MLVTIKHLFTSLPTRPYELGASASASASVCSHKAAAKKSPTSATVTHIFIFFISYSFAPFISRWQVVTLPKSFVLLKNTLNYSPCFMRVAATVSRRRARSFWVMFVKPATGFSLGESVWMLPLDFYVSYIGNAFRDPVTWPWRSSGAGGRRA